jgi:hypothetical protein
VVTAEIIPLFRTNEPEARSEIDLETAVDVAIRDLNDVRAHWGTAIGLQRLRECQELLQRAYTAPGQDNLAATKPCRNTDGRQKTPP